jgi:nitrite reductase/ring-hydroxylating ferredoxin subunit
MQFYPLEKLVNLYEGYCQLFRLGTHQLLLVQAEQQLYIFESHCPHNGHSLAGASISSDIIQCSRHDYHFCLRSGKVIKGSGQPCRNLRVYTVSYEGRDVGVVL